MNTWGLRKTIGAIAVAATVAGVGGAAIAAATDTGYHGMSGGMHGPGGPGGPPPPPPAHRADVQPDALHGEYVVSNGNGGYTTMVSQAGRVTAISPTAVTARSDDGFVQTYVIRQVSGAVTPPFAVADEVVIDATRVGQTATVTSIRPPLAPGH